MHSITIRVLEGMEQGKVYSRLPLPVSVGREEENSIQLNDDRISRFHAKLQYHSGRVILTDLASTNGTRVNGHPVQTRILQAGDVISIGRCQLLLSERLADDDDDDESNREQGYRTKYQKTDKDGVTVDDESEIFNNKAMFESGSEFSELFRNGPPELPSELNALQRAQFSDLTSFMHERLGRVIKNGCEDLDESSNRTITCDWDSWSELVALQSYLAEILCKINNPS